MSKFNETGFLSSELEGWIKQVNTEFKSVFGLADRINRLGMKVLFDLPAENIPDSHIVANLCFGKALQSFQCAVLLAERGALADSRALIRSCAENAIALSALRVDPNMPTKMAEAHDHHRLKLVNALLTRNNEIKILSDDEVLVYEQVRREIRAQYGDSEPKGIKWATMAAKGDTIDLYNVIYRLTSGDGIHSTVLSIGRNLAVDATDCITGFRFHPDKSDLNQSLLLAYAAMLQAVGLVIDWFELDVHRAELQGCVEEFDRDP